MGSDGALELALSTGEFDDPLATRLALTAPDRVEALDPPLRGAAGALLRDGAG